MEILWYETEGEREWLMMQLDGIPDYRGKDKFIWLGVAVSYYCFVLSFLLRISIFVFQ